MKQSDAYSQFKAILEKQKPETRERVEAAIRAMKDISKSLPPGCGIIAITIAQFEFQIEYIEKHRKNGDVKP